MHRGHRGCHHGRMHHVEGRPQVVAHRGSSHDNPEHTLGAYLAALDTAPTGSSATSG